MQPPNYSYQTDHAVDNSRRTVEHERRRRRPSYTSRSRPLTINGIQRAGTSGLCGERVVGHAVHSSIAPAARPACSTTRRWSSRDSNQVLSIYERLTMSTLIHRSQEARGLKHSHPGTNSTGREGPASSAIAEPRVEPAP